MNPGTKVRMSEELKQVLIKNDCQAHVDEFGSCIGIVIEDTDNIAPDVDVRWQPSNLRYAYHPKFLEEIKA